MFRHIDNMPKRSRANIGRQSRAASAAKAKRTAIQRIASASQQCHTATDNDSDECTTAADDGIYMSCCSAYLNIYSCSLDVYINLDQEDADTFIIYKIY